MKQSMSRVAHCIDNGPMEGFWGILKREMYYCQHFNDRTTLIAAITDYIHYYNNQRLQRKLNVMTPMEYHNQYIKVAENFSFYFVLNLDTGPPAPRLSFSS